MRYQIDGNGITMIYGNDDLSNMSDYEDRHREHSKRHRTPQFQAVIYSMPTIGERVKEEPDSMKNACSYCGALPGEEHGPLCNAGWYSRPIERELSIGSATTLQPTMSSLKLSSVEDSDHNAKPGRQQAEVVGLSQPIDSNHQPTDHHMDYDDKKQSSEGRRSAEWMGKVLGAMLNGLLSEQRMARILTNQAAQPADNPAEHIHKPKTTALLVGKGSKAPPVRTPPEIPERRSHKIYRKVSNVVSNKTVDKVPIIDENVTNQPRDVQIEDASQRPQNRAVKRKALSAKQYNVVNPAAINSQHKKPSRMEKRSTSSCERTCVDLKTAHGMKKQSDPLPESVLPAGDQNMSNGGSPSAQKTANVSEHPKLPYNDEYDLNLPPIPKKPFATADLEQARSSILKSGDNRIWAFNVEDVCREKCSEIRRLYDKGVGTVNAESLGSYKLIDKFQALRRRDPGRKDCRERTWSQRRQINVIGCKHKPPVSPFSLLCS